MEHNMTFKLTLRVNPKYKDLFEEYEKQKKENPMYIYANKPKLIKEEGEDDTFVYHNGKKFIEPNLLINIIGNMNNDFIHTFIDGQYSEKRSFYTMAGTDSWGYEIIINIDSENIIIKLFDNLDKMSASLGGYEQLHNTFLFPYKRILNDFINLYVFLEYGETAAKYLVHAFTDITQESLNYNKIFYSLDKTIEWHNLLSEVKNFVYPINNIKDSKIIIADFNSRNKMEIYKHKVKSLQFVHKFYTVSFNLNFYKDRVINNGLYEEKINYNV